MSPPEEPREPAPEGAPGERDQPTEEQFAVGAGVDSEGAREPFEGIPPDQLPPPQPLPESGEFPALDPEFADALREAGQADAEPVADPGETVEYAPAEAPDKQAAEPEAPAETPAEQERPAEADQQAAEPEAPAETPAEQERPAEADQQAAEPGAPTEVVAAAALPPPPAPPPPAAAPPGAVPPPPAVTAPLPVAFGKPPPDGDPEPAPRPKRYWWRFSLAAFTIVVAIAAATASSILLYLDDIADALGHGGKLQRQLSPILQPYDGGPQNILILGSDKRAGTPGDPGRSDTTMMLRLDPGQSRIALMSIPRDLKVDIPGYGINKFNAAYTYGGPKLTLQMVKRLTGLQFNHVVNVDFLGFVRAVDAIGCVWTDVDRRYFHSNEGVPPSEQYSEINIKAGYQRLCGKDALAYVRYRHTDTDLVRSARQQDFLREARQRVPLSTLVGDYPKLIKIFTTYTTSDINSGGDFLDVLKLFFEARGASIKEVHFPAVLGPSYVYASRSAIRKAVNQFLNLQPSGGPRGSLDIKKKRKKKHKSKAPGDDGLVPEPTAGKLAGEAVARKVGPGFGVFYPTRLPSGSYLVSNSSYEHIQNPRAYHLRDTGGDIHGAYRMTLQLPQGDYFGLQGIRGWGDPPILSGPSETITYGGRDFDVYYDGDRVRLVAWHQGDNTYWVANSLLQTLTNQQMVGIARSTEEITPKARRGRKGRGSR
ncbi:MAG: LCP family protein [Solirubrobacterales bacterium]